MEIDLEAGQQTLRFAFDGTPATNGHLLDFRAFTLEAVENEPDVIGYSGVQTIAQSGSGAWTSVSFASALDNPSVVMGPLTFNGNQPAAVRVRDVTDTGFEFQVDEWDDLDGGHTTETIGWFAVESGVHQLANGAVIEAGSVLGGTSAQTVALNGSFGGAPVVLGQAVTDNDPSAITTRLDDVTSDSFVFEFQEEENADDVHATEELDYIALSKGSFGSFAAGATGDVVTHTGATVNLPGGPGDADGFAFLADMQSLDGGDTATVRLKNISSGSANFFIEEEKSADGEINHTTETVGWLAVYDETLLA